MTTTTLLGIGCGLVIAALSVLAYRQARAQLVTDAYIRALQKSAELAKADAATQRNRADWLANRNGELEDRAACLERIHRKAALAYVLELPEMDAPKVLAAKARITLN